jgi:hypothetical protein
MTTPEPTFYQPAASSAVDDARTNMAQSIGRIASNWTGGEATQGIDSTARHILNGASQEILKAVGALEGSRAEARAWEANLDVAAAGREARSRDALESGQAAAAAALANAQASAEIGEGLLVQASAPSFGENFRERSANTAQAERRFSMALDSAKDNGGACAAPKGYR